MEGALPGEAAYVPSIEQQQGRPEIFDNPREWYAQAQAKSVYLECRGQRGLHPKDAFFWIERASLPQSGPLFEDIKANLGCMLAAVGIQTRNSFYLLEYILLSKALIAVASPHYFSRGWCLFEFACKLASTSSTDSAALGIAWKAFVNFGSRKDGFDAQLYAEVIHEISIEKAEFTVNADREALLCLVDRLFTSRFAFDRFAKFAALSRLGRSCYTREDRQPFSVLACREGFERLGELLDSDCSFDPRKAEVENFDAELRSLFEEERSTAVHVEIVEELQQRAKEARFKSE